jgi:hypothetical protein
MIGCVFIHSIDFIMFASPFGSGLPPNGLAHRQRRDGQDTLAFKRHFLPSAYLQRQSRCPVGPVLAASFTKDTNLLRSRHYQFAQQRILGHH